MSFYIMEWNPARGFRAGCGVRREAIYLGEPAGADSTQAGLVPDAAVRGDMLYTGGVSGFDTSGKLPESNEDQAAQIYERIARILDKSGFSSDDIGHWFMWALERHKDRAVNPHWERWFKPSSPGTSCASELDRAYYRMEIINVRRTAHRLRITRTCTTSGTVIPGSPFRTTMGVYLHRRRTPYGDADPGEDTQQAEHCAASTKSS